ncbi:signal peptide containing protein [Cryptosporidium canis]|uniref:Signal peptide containing protein n=1 Tax=Cryptosporidium canis TaxID=195482 RepID=A0A9D5HWC5_9CRYT|nr:signal peptide containing protein [Cryptosporidium canis]
MVRCKFFVTFFVIFGCLCSVGPCLGHKFVGDCENYEITGAYLRVAEGQCTGGEKLAKRNVSDRRTASKFGSRGLDGRSLQVGDSQLGVEQWGRGGPNLNKAPKRQAQAREYFTNLNPSDCRITILRRHNIRISRVSVAVMESFERLLQLLDILLSRRPCPYCRGCVDLRLDSLPIWVPPILQRQIRRVNSQLDNKLCLILKKDSKLNGLIRRIIWYIKDERWNELHAIAAQIGDIYGLVTRTKLRRRENFPIYLLGGILELMLDDLRQSGMKISSCHPSQFLFKCSWHPNKQNIEISAKLKAVSESMLLISKSLEFDYDVASHTDRGGPRFSFSRRLSGERSHRRAKKSVSVSEDCVLNRDIIRIPTSPGTQSSCISASLGASVGSNLSSEFGSHASLQKKCIPPFLDSMIMLREDGSPSPSLEICSPDTIKHKDTVWEEADTEAETDARPAGEDVIGERTNLKVIQGVPYVSQLAALHYDYASSSSNSKLLSWSEGVLRPKSVQSSNPDSYLLVPCSKPMWFVIGFQEDIFLEYIALFSLEYFSSSFREIEISGSLIYPTKQWVPIGILRRNEVLPKEMFNLKTLCVKQETAHGPEGLYYSLSENLGPRDSKASVVKEPGSGRSFDRSDQRDSSENLEASLRKEAGVGHIKENHLVQDSNPCWVRYIRVRAISYYEEGHYYCHLNRIQIFGNNVINRLEVEMGGGDRRSSISISEMEESVKDVENRLWKRDIDRGLHGSIHGEKPRIMYLNSSDLGLGGGRRSTGGEAAPMADPNKLGGRSLLTRTPDKGPYMEKREMFGEEADSPAARQFSNSKGHPLLSLIDRVKVLEKQLDAIKQDNVAIIVSLNSSLDPIHDSIYRLSSSVKFLQDILLDSNLNNTTVEQDNKGNVRNLKLGDTYLSQALGLIGRYLERFMGSHYSWEVVGYLTHLLERMNWLIVNLFRYVYSNLQTLIVATLFIILFISQIILFKKYISLKRRLHNTLQFFKSYSQSSGVSPRSSILLDETIYFQKNLKLHSNPVTSSFRVLANQSSNYSTASFINIGTTTGGNPPTEGDSAAGGPSPTTPSAVGGPGSTSEPSRTLPPEEEAAAPSLAVHQKGPEVSKTEGTSPPPPYVKLELQETVPGVPDVAHHLKE